IETVARGRWQKGTPKRPPVFKKVCGSDRSFGGSGTGVHMRYMKSLALLAVLTMPLAYSQAQVEAGVAAGNNQGYADQGQADRNYPDQGQGQADRGYPDQGPANQGPARSEGYPDRGYSDQTYAG